MLVQLGYPYGTASQKDKAIPLYERVLRLDPSQVTAAVNLASAWIKCGRTEEALRLWRDAVSRNTALETARINIAGAQLRSGDRKGARETFTARRLLAEWR